MVQITPSLYLWCVYAKLRSHLLRKKKLEFCSTNHEFITNNCGTDLVSLPINFFIFCLLPFLSLRGIKVASKARFGSGRVLCWDEAILPLSKGDFDV